MNVCDRVDPAMDILHIHAGNSARGVLIEYRTRLNKLSISLLRPSVFDKKYTTPPRHSLTRAPIINHCAPHSTSTIFITAESSTSCTPTTRSPVLHIPILFASAIAKSMYALGESCASRLTNG